MSTSDTTIIDAPGVSAAIAEGVGAAAAELAAGAPEPDLFAALPTRYAGAPALAEAVRDKAATQGGIARRGKSLVTKEWRGYILQRYGSPLEWLARWCLHSPDTLAEELGCTRLEAWDRLARMRYELAPYLHAKMAPSDDKGNAIPAFQFIMGDASIAGLDQIPPWFSDPEVARNLGLPPRDQVEQYQGVSEEAELAIER